MALYHLPYMVYSIFTQTFFIPAAPLTERTLPDQTGKTFIVTGGYTGVGFEVASILYSKNGTVWIAGRSETKASDAIDRLTTLHPQSSGHLHFLKVDLSDLTTIKPAVTDFLRRNTSGKLHWLNNNAGVMVPPKGSKGAQGHDLQYVTNIYGPFLLTKLLLPILRSTAKAERAATNPQPVRVSWAGSIATVLSRPHGGVSWAQNDLAFAHADPQTGYAISKCANYYLATEFGRRSGDADGVLHNAYNPGNLYSELQRHVPALGQWLFSWTGMLYPARFGAYTELYAGLAEDLSLEGDQGGWVIPWGRSSRLRPDIEAEALKAERGEEGTVGGRLWEWSEEVVKEYG